MILLKVKMLKVLKILIRIFSLLLYLLSFISQDGGEGNCYRVRKDQGKALQAIVCLHALPRTSSSLSFRVCTRLPTSQAMCIALQAILRLHVFPKSL